MTKPFPYKVPIGSDIILDDQTWRVAAKDRDGFLVTGDDGAQTLLTFDRIKNAIVQSKCTVIAPKDREEAIRLKEYTNGFTDIAQLPKEQQRNARALAAIINAIDELEAEGQKITQRYLDLPIVRRSLYARAIEVAGDTRLFEGVTFGSTKPKMTEPDSIIPKGRTLSEKRATYIGFGRNPVVLGHRHHMKGLHGEAACKLSEWQVQFVLYCLNRRMNTTAPALSSIYNSTLALMPVPEEEMLAGRTHPSLVTVRNWKHRLSFVAQQYAILGPRAAKNRYGSGSTDQRALMFGERAVMDQVYLSIFTKSDGTIETKEIDPETVSPELEPEEVIRVWMHLMIDTVTRLPLAWIISETASADHTLDLLLMATRDKTKEKVEFGCKGAPAPPAGLLLTVADNGTATRNGPVYSSQLGMGTALQTGRTYHSNDNPHAERIFGTVQFDALNFEGGYVGSKPGDNPGYDPKANTRLTPYDIMGVVTRYFVDEYSNTPHRGIGMFGATPNEKLDEVKEQYGGIEAPNPENRIIQLGLKRTVSTTSEGILFDGIPYTSPKLNKFHDGKPKKVDVYLDPNFLGKVIVRPHGMAENIEAKLSYTAYSDLSYFQAKKLMKAAAEGNPENRNLTNKMLLEARAERARRSGFYKDPNCHESYMALPRHEKMAEANAQIGPNKGNPIVQTVKPGSITARPKKIPPKGEAHPSTAPQASNTKSSGSFAPITKSKL
ncbi:Mu transposase C-terminal domain-containing protein [Celeribacter sp.]|uniref:Mu transposase C-terminal domain-containing protein n=1 Tax=Celeribacter sp. TaxID=1890673 RepID=UPI003A92DEE7